MFDSFRFLNPGGRSNRSRKHSTQHRRLLCEALEARTMLSGLALVQQAKLTASDGAASASFGGAVAVSGNTMVVGAWYYGRRHQTRCGLRVHRDRIHLDPDRRAYRLDGAAGDGFGGSVSISGNTIVVGAVVPRSTASSRVRPTCSRSPAPVGPRPPSLPPPTGRQANLSPPPSPSAPTRSWSGRGCATVGGNTIRVRPMSSRSPAGPTWTQTAKLTASDGAAGELFGGSVAIEAATDTVVVGARGPCSTAAPACATESAAGWINMTQTAELTASEGGGRQVRLGWPSAAAQLWSEHSGPLLAATRSGRGLRLRGAQFGLGEPDSVRQAHRL